MPPHGPADPLIEVTATAATVDHLWRARDLLQVTVGSSSSADSVRAAAVVAGPPRSAAAAAAAHPTSPCSYYYNIIYTHFITADRRRRSR